LGTSSSNFINFQSAVPEIFPDFPVRVGVVLKIHQNFKVAKNGKVAYFWNPKNVQFSKMLDF
jgi:hypothetical protein